MKQTERAVITTEKCRDSLGEMLFSIFGFSEILFSIFGFSEMLLSIFGFSEMLFSHFCFGSLVKSCNPAQSFSLAVSSCLSPNLSAKTAP